ncbi:MAG TPA: hypothetical protein VF960_05505, partial [Chloroflexota bacterium]
MRGVRRFCQPVSIWPSFFSAERMIWVARKMVESYREDRVVVLNMMLHSMEIIPLASPYVRTDDESRAFLGRMGSVFAFCKELGARFETLSAVHAAFDHSRLA